jgi:hypothetical protein
MKIFTLSIAMLLLSVMAYSQNCIKAISALFTNPSNDGITWVLTVNWEADGQKHMDVSVKVGIIEVLNTCFTVQSGGHSAGTQVYPNIIAPLGIPSLSASFSRYTGNCGGGSSCGTTQIIPPGGGTLPIQLSSFYAKRNGNSVTLTWTSEAESNAKEYVIERNSGSGFVAIGTVAATNNSGGSSYSYVDNNSSKAVSQYRLMLVDKDASFKLSEIKAVKGTAAVSDFTVYPNPSVGYAKISITDITEATNVEVIDNAGRVVRSIELKTSSSVEVNNLQSGIYLVRIINKASGDAVTKKLTVSN